MSKLAALRPTNEAEERERFFAALSAGERYEPQLRYAQPRRAAEIRSSCDKHLSDEYGEIAQRIMRGVIDAHGSEAAYCENVWGRTIERPEVDAACDAYLAQNGFDGEVDFIWSPHTLVTTCLGSKVHLVTRPRYYREARLASLLDHEVGTHFVRAHNHRKVFGRAKWASRTTGWLLSTEEGLATINTVRSYDDKARAQPSPTRRARRRATALTVPACALQRLWVPALHYHACALASRLSFSSLWHELSDNLLGDDAERLWTTCMRCKRGLEDTGAPGGYYKDQANLRGAVRLLAARREIDFTLLHCVRVSIEDFPRATPAAWRACAAGRVLLPRFVSEADAYRRELDEIAAANGIA